MNTTYETSFVTEEESAREFSGHTAASRYAARRGLRVKVSRCCACRNAPASHGGYILVDLDRSRPCDPCYVG